MSGGNVHEECYQQFLENHIILRDEWMNDVLNFVRQRFPSCTGRRLYNLLFEQWLHSNLSDTSFPVLESIDTTARKFQVDQPLVLQITSLVDVGSSLLSQFNKLTYEFVDNTGFDVDFGEKKEDNLYQAKPSRCLMLTLSDGERELKGMERRHIPSLSLLTSPGCKIVLRPPLICRKGVFLLTSSNIQVLGGDDPTLMEIGRPLQVMSRILEKELPKKKEFSHLNNTKPNEMDDEEQMIREFEEMENQFDPSDFEPLPSSYDSFPTTPPPPPSSSVPSLPPPSAPSPSPNFLPTPRPPPRSIPSSSTPITPLPHSSTPRLDNTQTTSSPIATQTSSTPSSSFRVVKTEPIEVIELDDDTQPSTSTGPTPNKEEVNVKRDSGGIDGVDESDRFIVAYRALRLITLEEAAKQSKYQASGSRRRIEALVDNFIEALRIVDNMWTMKISLKDDSREGVECVIHSTVLEKLIGLTVDEAIAIKQSSDMERKQEGATRLAATEEILSRLDLIWTIEFFPSKSKLSPIVRDVQTLAEILNAFD
ncbi:hypothetical protein PFISCL1PPCAC_2414 [Pristionchus fissidentatus]|uniref:RecQ-mediated genome instability protein 1 n=1 Tax=Pristionchus fissidentatus TaxID=1538716 RepID=A0AAV5UWZ1_9BILA|nr:hypothetical protein PFISCL1PPCAC_2414 [Pristionchus fissidentatus]